MNPYKNCIFALLLLAPLFVAAQKSFPELTGKTLTNKALTLPESTKGKYTLIGMAYSKKADEDLRTWFQPLYETFIQKHTSSFIPVEEYDVNIYFIPMITGIAKTASGKIEDKIRKSTDKELQSYILLYEGEIKTYKDQLKMTEKDTPYFFVLDPEGKIVQSFSGAYSEDKLDIVLDQIEE